MTAIAFADPSALLLLVGPALLGVLWLWVAARRIVELRRVRIRRTLPERERFRRFGDLLFWLSIIVATTLLILAVARPQAPTTVPQRSGLDLIVLQDASASMSVRDEGAHTRWQHSMAFLREVGDALSWTNDRIAMVAFAHLATPQIRLTRDPNTLFFFLDHLHARPPYRLEDDATWDTNLEQAISWGMRMVDKDLEIHGRSPNATVFLMLSDGEAWSGEVAKAVALAASRGIPLYVVGVGRLGGGPLPVVETPGGERLPSPGTSRLERASLQRIAEAGGGAYFELERDGPRLIANSVIAAGRRVAPPVGMRQSSEDLYRYFVLAAGAVAALGLATIRQRGSLGILLAGSLATGALLAPVLW